MDPSAFSADLAPLLLVLVSIELVFSPLIAVLADPWATLLVFAGSGVPEPIDLISECVKWPLWISLRSVSVEPTVLLSVDTELPPGGSSWCVSPVISIGLAILWRKEPGGKGGVKHC